MRYVRSWRGAVRRVINVPTLIALIALGVATGAPAEAVTGGNFILGTGNAADKTTTLTGGPPAAATLSIASLGTAGGAVPLILTPKPGVAPIKTASTVKVSHLNADLLDGLDSTALQRRVTGSCSGGQAISSIATGGAVNCATSADLLAASATNGPLPNTDVGDFTLTKSEVVDVDINGTGYRPPQDGEGVVDTMLLICQAAPCDSSASLISFEARIWANLTNVHVSASTVGAISLPPGHYFLGLDGTPDTATDQNDQYSWSLIGFPF